MPEDEIETFELIKDIALHDRQGVSTRVLTSELSHCAYHFFNWGQRDKAEMLWRDVEDLVERTRDAGVQIYPLRDQMMRLYIDGRLEESVALRERMVELTGQSGSTQLPQLGALTRVYLRLGRLKEALETATFYPRAAALGYTALCHADSGDRAQAKELLRDLLPFVSKESDVGLTTLVVAALEIAVLLEERETVKLLSSRLAPLAHLAGAYREPNCLARHLGAASALLDEADEACTYYQQAIEVCTRVRFRPELALSRLQLAELMLEHFPDERPAAIEHLDFAIGEFRDMKMQPSLERSLRHREPLKA